MAEAYRLYAGTQSGMIIFRGVGDIWTSMGGSREFEPYFKEKSDLRMQAQPEIVLGVTRLSLPHQTLGGTGIDC
jgi:hypothetical protein